MTIVQNALEQQEWLNENISKITEALNQDDVTEILRKLSELSKLGIFLGGGGEFINLLINRKIRCFHAVIKQNLQIRYFYKA